jgi:BMFP domain-containing protein YqiC
MTDRERFHAVANALLTIRRENLRTLARLKALEAASSKLVAADKRDEWYESIDRLSEKILQQLLESFEKDSPSFAAELDDRSEDELKGVE